MHTLDLCSFVSVLRSVYPDWDLKTAHSTVIQEWMKGVNATDNDVMLMLNTFLSSP